MDIQWYSVPSLQYQAAIQIAVHLLRDPAIFHQLTDLNVDSFIKEGLTLFPTNVTDNEAFHVAIGIHDRLANLPVTEINKCAVSSVVSHVALQLKYWFNRLINLFECLCQLSLSNDEKDQLLQFVQWNAEGCVNLESTVNTIRKNPSYRSRCSYFEIKCDYFLKETIHIKWKVRTYGTIGAFFPWNLDYNNYEKEIESLQDDDFWDATLYFCITLKDIYGARLCWKHLSSLKRREIAHRFVLNWETKFEDYVDNICYGEILRLCLSGSGVDSVMDHVLSLKPSQWIPALLIRFRFQPERSIVQQLKRMVPTYMPIENFQSVLISMKEVTDGSSPFYKHVNDALFAYQ